MLFVVNERFVYNEAPQLTHLGSCSRSPRIDMRPSPGVDSKKLHMLAKPLKQQASPCDNYTVCHKQEASRIC